MSDGEIGHMVLIEEGWASKRQGDTRALSTQARARAAGRAATNKDGVEHLVHPWAVPRKTLARSSRPA